MDQSWLGLTILNKAKLAIAVMFLFCQQNLKTYSWLTSTVHYNTSWPLVKLAGNFAFQYSGFLTVTTVQYVLNTLFQTTCPREVLILLYSIVSIVKC